MNKTKDLEQKIIDFRYIRILKNNANKISVKTFVKDIYSPDAAIINDLFIKYCNEGYGYRIRRTKTTPYHDLKNKFCWNDNADEFFYKYPPSIELIKKETDHKLAIDFLPKCKNIWNVDAIRKLTKEQLEIIDAVDNFIYDGNVPQIAIYERELAYCIFGDEKYFDDLKKYNCLKKCMINSPENILNFKYAYRFIDSRCGDCKDKDHIDILVLENTDIFRTIEEYLKLHSWNLGNQHYNVVMMGNGMAINNKGINEYMNIQFPNKKITIHYCGDLDVTGLIIYYSLKEIFMGTVVPCYYLYNLMIEINKVRSTKLTTKKKDIDFNDVNYIDFEQGIEDKNYLKNLLRAGKRVAQETININVLNGM